MGKILSKKINKTKELRELRTAKAKLWVAESKLPWGSSYLLQVDKNVITSMRNNVRKSITYMNMLIARVEKYEKIEGTEWRGKKVKKN